MARRHYKGAAVATTITATLSSSATSMTIAAASGWPDGTVGPFYVVIDRGTVSEESVLIQSRTGTTLTVATNGRGSNDTIATSHASGAAIEHVFTKADADEANEHVNAVDPAGHSSLLNVARHDLTSRHLVGTSIGAAVAGTSVAGDTANAGTATTVARSDHRHDRAADPQGLLGQGLVPGTQSGIVSETTLTGVTVTTNSTPGTRWVRISVQLKLETNAAADPANPVFARVRIYYQSVTILAEGTYFLHGANNGTTAHLEAVVQASGNHTFICSVARATGGGSITSSAATGMGMNVEDLGQV